VNQAVGRQLAITVLDSWLIDDGKVVSPTHFTPQKHYFFLMFLVLICVRG
jgi:hypothetical protein